MNAATPSIGAPDAAHVRLKKLGSAIAVAIGSTAFAVTIIAAATLAYIVLISLGNGAHGQISDGAIIFACWIVPLVLWLAELDERHYRYGSRKRFENERLHRAALWWSEKSLSQKWHIACWPVLLALFWSSTAMQYSAPGASGMTTGCGEYVVRVGGVTLSAETPMVRSLPWRYEWVPVRRKYSASARVTSPEGIKFDVTVTADLALGDNPNLWPWQSEPVSGKYPKIESALVAAAKVAVGKTPGREIDRGTFALEIDTAAALKLAEAGVRPDGEISISLKPYFDGSEAKLGAEKK